MYKKQENLALNNAVKFTFFKCVYDNLKKVAAKSHHDTL